MQKLRGSVECTLEAIKEGVQAWPICCFLIRAAQECLFTVIKWEHKGSSASAGGILLTSSTAAKSFCGHTQLLISSWINAWDREVFWLMQTVQTAIVLASYNHWSITHALIKVSHPPPPPLLLPNVCSWYYPANLGEKQLWYEAVVPNITCYFELERTFLSQGRSSHGVTT